MRVEKQKDADRQTDRRAQMLLKADRLVAARESDYSNLTITNN